MANRQIDPNGPYMVGYQDAEEGREPASNFGRPYYSQAQSREYRDGYNAAKFAERAPA